MALAGVDTWSVCWQLDNDSTAEHMAAIATGRTGRFNLLPDLVEGHRVIYDRTNRLVMAEGHPVPGCLAPFTSEVLVEVQEALADGIEDYGIRIPRQPCRFDRQGSVGCAGMRRLDFTVDLERPADVGRAILSGVAAVEPAGLLRSTVHRDPRHRIATVTWEGSKGKVARAYDKGLESGSHAPGRRVRLEAQCRFPRGTRIHTDEVVSDTAAFFFRERFKRLWAAKKGLTVTNTRHALDILQEAVNDGEITPATSLKILGYLVAEQQGVELGSRSSRYRQKAAARELGLVLVDGANEPVTIDLAVELLEARDATFV